MKTKNRSPRTKDQWLKQGNDYYRTGKYKQAISAYEQAIYRDHKYIEAYIAKGIALFCLENASAALSIYDQAIHIAPNFAEIYVNKGETLFYLGCSIDALAAYQKAAQLDPFYQYIYLIRKNLFQDHKSRKQVQDSIKGQRLLEEGKGLCKLSDYSEACKSLQQAILYDAFNADIYEAFGTTLYKMRHFERACIAYLEAIELKPSNKYNYETKTSELLNIGIRFQTNGNWNKALKTYENAIQFNPVSKRAVILRNWATNRLQYEKEKEKGNELWNEPFRYEWK